MLKLLAARWILIGCQWFYLWIKVIPIKLFLCAGFVIDTYRYTLLLFNIEVDF